ncbi:MAG TPA: L-histidine N(alpha)-methyltransferase [Pirellulales bacterium]|nr:L-histidine N(alpha)-methyltransferase [Pirellulales bacterium]
MRYCQATQAPVRFYNLVPGTANLEERIVRGLVQTEKELPSSLLYDARGVRLFDRIGKQDGYSLVRRECRLLGESARELRRIAGKRSVVVDYGSGTSRAGLALLRSLARPADYVAVDASLASLKLGVGRVRRSLPWLRTIPVRADFTSCFALPAAWSHATRLLVYVSSSAFSTLSPSSAMRLLEGAAGLCGQRGGIVVGVDLRCDCQLDDFDGDRLRSFNLNALVSLNRQFSATFHVDRFAHRACWNRSSRRVELQLVSRVGQTAKIDHHKIRFRQGEAVRTECSQRYRWNDIEQMSREVRLTIDNAWSDDERRLALVYLRRSRDR